MRALLRSPLGVATLLGLVLALPSQAVNDDGCEPSEDGSLWSWCGSLYVAGLYHDNAYFGSEDQPKADDGDAYRWIEPFGRVQIDRWFGDKVRASFAVGLAATLGEDYYGVKNDITAHLMLAHVAAEDIGGSGVDLTVGRQSIVIGDGFLIGDGLYDDLVALWTLPFSHWDAVRVDWGRGGFASTAMVAHLSDTFGPQDGVVYGVDLGWSWGDTEDAEDEPGSNVAASWFGRSDDGPSDNDAEVVSVRARIPVGPVTLGGEFAREFGTIGSADLEGTGFHADVRWDMPFATEPYIRGRYISFSGDDPETVEDEGWYNWFYSPNDWGEWYIGNITGSLLLDNTDEDVIWLEGGFAPNDAWLVRLFLFDISVDTGAWLGVPDLAGERFSREANLVADWEVRDDLFLQFGLSAADPGPAGTAGYGGDETSYDALFNVTWEF